MPRRDYTPKADNDGESKELDDCRWFSELPARRGVCSWLASHLEKWSRWNGASDLALTGQPTGFVVCVDIGTTATKHSLGCGESLRRGGKDGKSNGSFRSGRGGWLAKGRGDGAPMNGGPSTNHGGGGGQACGAEVWPQSARSCCKILKARHGMRATWARVSRHVAGILARGAPGGSAPSGAPGFTGPRAAIKVRSTRQRTNGMCGPLLSLLGRRRVRR